VDPDVLLADLDADQRRAVTTESTLVAVVAGAGSGKTRVLTRRVAHRIATGSADGAHTLVLTFTREAAGELRRRLPRLGLTERITAGTFHAICHQLLRQRWADLDQAPRTIMSDRRRVVARFVARDDVDAIVAEIEFASARGLGPAAYEQAVRRGERRSAIGPEAVAAALEAYRAEKRRAGVLDLDDLLAQTIDAIEGDRDFAETVRWRFRHVLVDEAQDLNPLQHRLVDLLRSGRDDLYLVGDPAQAIYGFNGSDPGLLVDVADRFPGIEVVRLPANHRCTPQIVAIGAHALRADGQEADVVSARPDGPVAKVAGHEDEQAEAVAVALAVARDDPDLVRAGRVAVLARTHATLGRVRDELARAGVGVRRAIEGAGSPIATILGEAYRLRSGEELRRWVRDQDDLADDAVRREVAAVTADFLREHPTGDGVALRAWVVDTDPFGAAVSGVELLTFHAAKGREWHTVHLLGCETGLVPHRSATTIAARAEEARLLYVALTRATDHLTVHWAQRRGGYQRKPSPLLDGFHGEPPVHAPPPTELVRRPHRDPILDRLREWRDTTARAAGILPDAVCSDRVLTMIAGQRPATPDELDEVTGLGAITARRLFDGIAAALADSPVPG
jgi:DNA helicase-2/ATP-dependent DNA helicase PcrA